MLEIKLVEGLQTRIERVSVPKGRRIIAVSDIHGYLARFKSLLEKVEFCDDDELFVVGDLTAKGPENLESIRYMMELDRRDNVHIMMGNMEYLHYSFLYEEDESAAQKLKWSVKNQRKNFGGSIYEDMLEELGLNPDDGLDYAQALQILRKAFAAEIEFMISLPVIIETDNLIFVHGGIPTENIQSLAATDPLPYLKNDDFLNQGYSFEKYVVVGHWPTGNYHTLPNYSPLISREQHVVSIDGGTGVVSVGQLNALVIADEHSMECSNVFCDEFPVRKALDNQSESKKYLCFEYNDRAIEIFEERGEKTYVRHKSTGAELWIPSENIWSDYYDGSPCATYNGYEHAVAAGELLRVCKEYEDGYYVKKDGICGWYRGRLSEL